MQLDEDCDDLEVDMDEDELEDNELLEPVDLFIRDKDNRR